MKLEQFPHIALLNKPDTKFKELDQKTKLNIESFRDSFKTWTTRKDPVMLEKLIARSEMIAQHLVNYFVEDEDVSDGVNEEGKLPPAPPATPEPIIDAKPLPKDEQALKSLFDKGEVEDITLVKLKYEGFNTGINTKLGMKGCRVGSYELIRTGSNHYKLIKHA